MLYLCPTPIGNLSDMTPRTLEVLRNADVVAAEDTRTSGLLLSHYEISKPLVSYHKFNEKERCEELLARLKRGENIALVTDAGMPGISDPGQILVRRCHEEGIPVTALPGPCAFVTALAMSGLESRRFTFEGFLPDESREREKVLEALRTARTTTIFYEAPHRLRKTLSLLAPLTGERAAALVREISKKFEETELGTMEQLRLRYEEKEPRGEYVILVEGLSEEESLREARQRYEEVPLLSHMERYAGLPEKEAMKKVAKDRGISKREVYEGLLKERGRRPEGTPSGKEEERKD